MHDQITPFIQNPWLGMALVLVALSGLMLGLKVYQARWQPHPETVRKLLHTIMGLITLTFPWVFQETWPVWVLAATSMVALFAVKSVSFMKKQLGDVIDGVKRRSLGDLYFPLAVAIVFQLAQDNLVVYLVPVMLLTFADAVAAIIGVRYGSMQYQTTEGIKSVQGSTAFFVVAFVAALIPLAAYTGLGWLHIILIATMLGVLVMMFEAIAWRGLDNLFIPLGAYFLLEKYLITPVSGLSIRLVVLLFLFAIVFAWRKRTPLNEGAALSLILVLYAIGVIGGNHWLIAPIMLAVSYAVLVILAEQQGNNEHSTFAIISICAAPILWLFLAQVYPLSVFYTAFVTAFVIQVGLIALANMSYRWPDKPRVLVFVYSVALALLVVLLPASSPLLFYDSISTGLWWQWLLGIVGLLCSMTLFVLWQPKMHDCPVDTNRWIRQGIAGLVGSAIPLLVLLK